MKDYHAKNKSYWGAKPFDRVKGEVANALIGKLYREAVEKIIKNLRDKANVRKMGSI